MSIYVGNLNHKVSEEEIKELFADFGEVKSVKIIKDNFTGKSRGFAFVEMENDAKVQEAIDALNETEFFERTIVVNLARPKTSTNNSKSGGYQRNKGFKSNY
jgi:RNA recognition motif-containing protein